MDISACHHSKEKWQALNTCKLWKAKCSNEERPISFAVSGFSPSLSSFVSMIKMAEDEENT